MTKCKISSIRCPILGNAALSVLNVVRETLIMCKKCNENVKGVINLAWVYKVGFVEKSPWEKWQYPLYFFILPAIQNNASHPGFYILIRTYEYMTLQGEEEFKL